MKKGVDFLKPGIPQIRKSIKDIDDSYNNDWDILAELIQNAVDAIRKKKKLNPNFKGTIKIIFDASKNMIIIEDNGVGIKIDRLALVLRPFETDKELAEDEVGEKGVGITYVLFCCNYCHIKSGHVDGGVGEVTVEDAYNWKNSSTNDPLLLDLNVLNEKYQGTRIELRDIKNTNIFNLNKEQIIFLLRTKTALGSTKNIWGEDVEIDINFTFINSDNTCSTTEKIDFSYFTLQNLYTKTFLDYDDFEDWLKAKDRTDEMKRIKLRDKILYKKGVFIHDDSREIKYLAYYVPNRSVWETISIDQNIYDEQMLSNDEWCAKYYYLGFNHGIQTAVKGMPTGISITPPQSGVAGYWSNLFILFEDNQLKFDIGRKSIHGSQANVLRKYAKKIFVIMTKYAKYMNGTISEDENWDKDKIFNEINSKLKLDNPNTLFQRVPSGQEATVAAIFFELIGRQKIKDIIPLLCGYKNRYDLYAKMDSNNIVVEFKAMLRSIFDDFNEMKKMFDEIDFIVCWGVDEVDELAVQEHGLSIKKIEASELLSTRRRIPNATHLLSLNTFVNPIYIIDIKEIIEA